jgi:hypothetical protein
MLEVQRETTETITVRISKKELIEILEKNIAGLEDHPCIGESVYYTLVAHNGPGPAMCQDISSIHVIKETKRSI